MPFSNQHPNKKSSRRVSEVAERETEPTGDTIDIFFDAKTGEIEPLDTYKVFLKRNLKWQTPPADLLSSIHARIDSIKAGKE